MTMSEVTKRKYTSRVRTLKIESERWEKFSDEELFEIEHCLDFVYGEEMTSNEKLNRKLVRQIKHVEKRRNFEYT